MRGIQYSDFVEVFNCLTALKRALLMVMTVRTELKVPFEKASPLALSTFWHPWACLGGALVHAPPLGCQGSIINVE